mgnify:CR=1 FL=1
MTNNKKEKSNNSEVENNPGVSFLFESDSSLLRYYFDVIRRRVWVIFSVFVVFFTTGVIRAFRAAPIYQAVARVMVETQTSRPTRFDPALEDNSGWDPDYYQTQVELIQSRAVLEKILEQETIKSYLVNNDVSAGEHSISHELKETFISLLGREGIKPEEQWEELRGFIRAKHIEDTRFIMIISECGTPEICTILANAAAQSFKEYYLQKKQMANDDVFGFLTMEIKQQEEKLKKAVEELQAFREKSPNITFGEGKNDQPVLENIDRLNKELTDTQLSRIDLEAQRTVVENMLRQSSTGEVNYIETIVSIPFVREDAAVKEKMEKLAAAEKNLAALANTYGPAHPRFTAAKKDIERLSNELEQIVKATVSSLESRLLTLKNKEMDLAAQLDKLRSEALVVTREAFEFNRLENEVERHKKIYDALVQRLMEIDVNAGFNRTNVEIVEPASVPKVPVRPNRGRMAFMAAFFGIIAGFALGFIIEHLDDTIKTPEDLQGKLSLPLIGFIPLVDTDKNKKIDTTDLGIISVKEPLSSISEAYRAIRTNLFFSIPSGKTKTLAFTSCGPGEGKTTIVTNLALIMAMSGKKTLLIDADLHRPMIHHLLGMERNVGLTNVLVGEEALELSLIHI